MVNFITCNEPTVSESLPSSHMHQANSSGIPIVTIPLIISSSCMPTWHFSESVEGSAKNNCCLYRTNFDSVARRSSSEVLGWLRISLYNAGSCEANINFTTGAFARLIYLWWSPNLNANVFLKLLRLRSPKTCTTLVKLRFYEYFFFSFCQRDNFLVYTKWVVDCRLRRENWSSRGIRRIWWRKRWKYRVQRRVWQVEG